VRGDTITDVDFIPSTLSGACLMPVICEGCGQRITIPAGYQRNKIQCPCGVICEVPEAERGKTDSENPKRVNPPAKSRSAGEEEAERWLLEEDPPGNRIPEPTEEPEPPPAVNEMRFPCRRCGRLVRRQRECPECNPEVFSDAKKEEKVWWPSVDTVDEKMEEEENASPYAVEGGDEISCPKCALRLPPGSILCVRCGYHLTKRKKIAKTYQPIERLWETNAPYAKRFAIFACCTLAIFVAGLLGVLQREVHLVVFLFGFSIVAVMLAFLLGTFDRIHLTRDVRGRVRLTKTWRVCFIQREPQQVDVRGHANIASGRHREIGFFEYFNCFLLLGFGILPGILWWYFAIHKITFHVSLCRDHGYPAYTVYSGWSEAQMKEIAYALRDASGLPYGEG
jgi:hypothetical protein